MSLLWQEKGLLCIKLECSCYVKQCWAMKEAKLKTALALPSLTRWRGCGGDGKTTSCQAGARRKTLFVQPTVVSLLQSPQACLSLQRPRKPKHIGLDSKLVHNHFYGNFSLHRYWLSSRDAPVNLFWNGSQSFYGNFSLQRYQHKWCSCQLLVQKRSRIFNK